MSKCQKNKYAANGKCGAMSNSAFASQPSVSGSGEKANPEINSSFASLLASREKQDALLFAASGPPNSQQAIVLVKNKKVISKSDIDTVLEGDF